MFAPTYFPPSFYPSSYFPEGSSAVPSTGGYFAAAYFAGTYFAETYFPGTTSEVVVLPADLWAAIEAYLPVAVPDLIGGVWEDEAPKDDPNSPDKFNPNPLPLPVAIFDQGPATTVGRSTEKPVTRSGTFTVAIYAGSKVESNRLAPVIEAALYNPPLVFRSGRLNWMTAATLFGGRRDPGDAPGGGPIYQAIVTVDYQYTTP